MADSRESSLGLARIPKRLAWLAIAPMLILTLPARSDADRDEAPSGAKPATTVAAPAPGVAVDAAVTEAPIAPARPQPDDRKRRVFMLLLMNSAGPVRPYGNLGR